MAELEPVLPLFEETVATGFGEFAGAEALGAMGGPVGMAVAGVGVGGYMLYNLIKDKLKDT